MASEHESLNDFYRVMKNMESPDHTASEPGKAEGDIEGVDRPATDAEIRYLSAVAEIARLRAALTDVIRICEAVRYTAGLGKKQMERVEAARAALKATP